MASNFAAVTSLPWFVSFSHSPTILSSGSLSENRYGAAHNVAQTGDVMSHVLVARSINELEIARGVVAALSYSARHYASSGA